MRCPSCGHECARDARFCSHCGVRLEPEEAASSGRQTDPFGADAERRMLHVMFCDVVGSTSLAERVDPEEYREVVRAYYGICADAVEHYEGYVAKHLGDGVLIFFGYPEAHDDDARRAVLAALEIAVAVPELRWPASSGGDERVNVRIGIHTGLTVVGEVGTGPTFEALAVGETTNLAARLQQLAVSGEVVVSETTRRLVDGYFELRGLGEQHLKGVSDPMRVYRVIGSVEHQRPALPQRSLFVGRGDELQRIISALIDVRMSHERFVTISGPAGAGKSRLVNAARADLGADDVHWVAVACSPFYRNTSLYPLVLLLRSEAGMVDADPPDARVSKLDALLQRVGVGTPDARPLLAALLGLDVPEHNLLEYPSDVRKRRTLEILADVLRGLSSDGPAAVVIEDLHWADPSTRELLASLIELPADARLLVLVTHRPGVRPWTDQRRPNVIELTLGPLTTDDVEVLIESLPRGAELSEGVVRDIVARADGVPFFVEELVKAAHESIPDLDAEEPSGMRAIPMTLHGVLTAQLDRLRPSKRVAQVGALLGRRFPVDLLAPLLTDTVDLDADLHRLVDADVLVPVATADRPTYEFRHALIQEAAYDSLLRSDRRRLHGQIAALYEAGHPDEVNAHPEVVGQHWQRSGRHELAVPHLKRAGDRSAQVHAHEEALAFYRHTVRSVEAVITETNGPAEPWVDTLIDVHERCGDILTLLRRRDEAEAMYRAALDRCHDPIRAARLHRSIGVVHEQRRQRALEAFASAELALGPAPERDEEWRREWIGILLARMRMHYWYDEGDEMCALEQRIRPFVDLGATPKQRAEFFDQVTLRHFRQERYAMSDEALRCAAEYVDAAEAAGDLTELASARFTYAFALVFGGRPDAAIPHLDAALDLTRRCGHRTIEIRCLSYLATAHRLSGRVDEAERFSTRSGTEAGAHQMIEYVGMASANLAWVALARGRPAEAAQRAVEAVEAWDQCEMAWPFRWLGLLPLLAIAVDSGDLPVVASCAAGILERDQQRLAEPIAGPLDLVVSAVARGDAATARAGAREALAAAAELGLLVR